MDKIPLLRSTIVLRFTDFLDQMGAPTERWLERSNLSPILLTNPERLIPMMQSCAFVERVARAEGIENLGCLVGQDTKASDLGQFGTMISHSLTLYDLLKTIEKTINLLNSGEHISLRWSTDALWLQSHLYVLDRLVHPHSQCFSLMAHLNILRLAMGSTWYPPEIHLVIKPNYTLLNLHGLEGVQVHFNQPCNAIKIPKDLVSQPLNTSTTSVGNFETLHQSAPALDLAPSLKQLIESLLPQGYPDVAQAAEASGMSVRSFQRRLTDVGLNYSQLVEQVRFNLAIRWLQDPEIKLATIAAELGYTEPANFTRAFRRWAGVSPREFRMNQRLD